MTLPGRASRKVPGMLGPFAYDACGWCGRPLPLPRTSHMRFCDKSCKYAEWASRNKEKLNAKRLAGQAEERGRTCRWCGVTDKWATWSGRKDECITCRASVGRSACRRCAGPMSWWGCPRCDKLPEDMVQVIVVMPDDNERVVYRSVDRGLVRIGGRRIRIGSDRTPIIVMATGDERRVQASNPEAGTRNSDEQRRQREREAVRTGADSDQARVLVSRVRAGELMPWHVVLLSMLGHAPARLVEPRWGDTLAPERDDWDGMLRALLRVSSSGDSMIPSSAAKNRIEAAVDAARANMSPRAMAQAVLSATHNGEGLTSTHRITVARTLDGRGLSDAMLDDLCRLYVTIITPEAVEATTNSGGLELQKQFLRVIGIGACERILRLVYVPWAEIAADATRAERSAAHPGPDLNLPVEALALFVSTMNTNVRLGLDTDVPSADVHSLRLGGVERNLRELGRSLGHYDFGGESILTDYAYAMADLGRLMTDRDKSDEIGDCLHLLFSSQAPVGMLDRLEGLTAFAVTLASDDSVPTSEPLIAAIVESQDRVAAARDSDPPRHWSIRRGLDYWSNDDGWTHAQGATRFTPSEQTRFSLPVGGRWVPGRPVTERAAIIALMRSAAVDLLIQWLLTGPRDGV